MPREVEGSLRGRGLRIAIVASRFNQDVTDRLLRGALDALAAHGVADEDTTVVWVPGSFEAPTVARKLATSGRYQAVVCLGAVVKKETAHFEYVAAEAARGIADVGRETGVPTIFGILTTYNHQQALARAGGVQGNRGADAAEAAVRMATLMQELS